MMTRHTFADYNVGKFIDLFDQGDTGYAVFEITAEPVIENGIASIAVTPIQHEGEASGVARLKDGRQVRSIQVILSAKQATQLQAD